MGILYALISMVFAGVNDGLFKVFIARPRQGMGLFVSGIGAVVTLVFGIGVLMSHRGITFIHWPISLGAGLMSLLANLLFISSFRSVSAGTGATIYRLNLVLVAVLSVLWLHEPVTPWKMTGIGLGVTAVLTLWERPQAGAAGSPAISVLGGGLLLLACGFRAVMAILYKLANTHGIPQFEMLFFTGLCWLTGGVGYALVRRERPLALTARAGLFSLVSGTLVCGITYFMLAATRVDEASITIPITQMSFVVTTLLGVLFLGERLAWQKGAAILLAIGCIAALCQ